jgi:hypothetical protein
MGNWLLKGKEKLMEIKIEKEGYILASFPKSRNTLLSFLLANLM